MDLYFFAVSKGAFYQKGLDLASFSRYTELYGTNLTKYPPK